MADNRLDTKQAETAVAAKCRELMDSIANDMMLFGGPLKQRVGNMTATEIREMYDKVYHGLAGQSGLPGRPWASTWSIQLQEAAIISSIHSIESALRNFAFTERRSAMIHEVMEIVIGRIALTLAEQGGTAFDSFSFYAKVKGRPE